MQINKSLFTIIMLIITLILIFLLVLPEFGRSNSLQANVFLKQNEYDSKALYYANISSLFEKLQSHQDALKKVDDALPSNISFAPFIHFFQQKGIESGLTIRAINFNPALRPDLNNPEVKNIIMGLNMSGTYGNFKHFLSILEQSDRLFEINSVSFRIDVTRKSDNKQQQTYNFDVEFLAHTY